MNSKVMLVAQREFMENVRTKAFWISLLLMPVILVAAIVVPTLLEQRKSARSYVVVDHSQWLAKAVARRAMAEDLARVLSLPPDPAHDRYLPEALTRLRGSGDPETVARELAGVQRPGDAASQDAGPIAGAATIQDWWQTLDADIARRIDRQLSRAKFERISVANPDPEVLNEMLAADQIFAYLVIDEDPVNQPAASRYVSRNLTDNDLERWFSGHASEIVREHRMAARDVEPELAAWLDTDFRLQRARISETGEEEAVQMQDMMRQWAPVAFVYLLWLSIFTISQMLLSNTVEEKSNRLMEVLLSSVSPFQLMLGKILGIAGTGLTMVGTWVGFLLAAALSLPTLFEGSSLDLDLGFLLGEPRYILSFLLYFVLGYLFYAAILVAIGSVCNTIKEAQNLQSPIVILLMVPLLLMMPISRDPNGSMAVALSYFPPTTPFVMMNRAAGDIVWWEYVLTTLVMLAAVALAIWAAAKIFRIGVLMTGKPPNLKELTRWIRAPVGIVPQRRE